MPSPNPPSLVRQPTHEHHHLSGLDAVNFPEHTEGGEHTDEYIARTKQGYISPDEEEVGDDRRTVVEERSAGENGASPMDAEKGQMVKLVSWKENDPDDPRNWSTRVKWVRTLIVSLTCFAVAIGSSLIVMDMPTVAEALHTSLDVVHLTVCLFVAGFGVGPLFFAPLSEIVGRKPVIFISMGLYFVFCFPSAFAQNAASLVVGRALAGIAASAPMTVIGGSIADMWATEDRGRPMAVFSSTVFMGPVVGPIIAGYLSAAGWRWNYYLMIIIVGVSWLAAGFFLPETYAVVLLRKRAQKLRAETGDQGYMTEQERHKLPLSSIIYISLFRPLAILFTEMIVLLFSLYLSFLYSLLYLLFFAVPIVFGEVHHFPLGSVGLAFVPILIGMLLAPLTALRWQAGYYARVTAQCKLHGSSVPPEARLPSMMIGSVLLPIGLFIFAWTSYASVHWIVPMIGTGIFGYSMIAIYTGANSYIIDSFPEFAASALAAKTLMSRLCGAAIPMFVDRLYHSQLGPQWSSCLLAIVATMMMPIPFLFFKYGATIRASSKRSTIA